MSTGGGSGAPADRRSYALARLRGEVLRYATVASTNATLRAMAEGGAPEGTVVVADEQTAGRGRYGRTWNSPAGAGLYCSVLLRPPVPAGRAQLLTLLAAVAAAEAVAALGAPAVEIKWPNDVLIGGRKACGILNETGLLGETVDWVVLGVGVNLTDDAIPPVVMMPATSLAAAGVATTAAAATDALLAAVDPWYARFLDDGPQPLLDRWHELSPTSVGHAVSVDTGSEVFEAVTDGISPAGHLRLVRDGRAVEVGAADVSLRRRQETGDRRQE